MTLYRRFTPISLYMLSINGMLGSAWLFAPFYAAKIAGPGAIIAWLIAGFGTIIIALTFAELSVLFPQAGGTAAFPQYSHGIITSFLTSWIAWLSAMTMAPIEVQAILQYAGNYFPSLIHLQHHVPLLTTVGFIWASLLLFLFCALNSIGYKYLLRSNFVLFLFKMLVIVLTIAALIHFSFHKENFAGLIPLDFSSSSLSWHAILASVATGGVAFAFTGFKHGVELAGEARNIPRAIPLALIGSLLTCLLLYLGLQIAFIGALHPQAIANGWGHLNFIGDIGPFAGLAAGLGLVVLVKLLYADALVSPAGAGLIYVTSTARILYAMSELKFMPSIFSKLNKHGLPSYAIFINFIVGLLLFLPFPGWQAMVGFLVSGMVISYAMGPVALLCLRYEMPAAERRFKLPAATFICYLAFYFCNLLAYWCGWATLSKLGIAMLVGFIIFASVRIRHGKIANDLADAKNSLWLFPYFIGLLLISYFGAFGGKQLISFGWDFLVIAIFSACMLYASVQNRAPATLMMLSEQFAE